MFEIKKNKILNWFGSTHSSTQARVHECGQCSDGVLQQSRIWLGIRRLKRRIGWERFGPTRLRAVMNRRRSWRRCALLHCLSRLNEWSPIDTICRIKFASNPSSETCLWSNWNIVSDIFREGEDGNGASPRHRTSIRQCLGHKMCHSSDSFCFACPADTLVIFSRKEHYKTYLWDTAGGILFKKYIRVSRNSVDYNAGKTIILSTSRSRICPNCIKLFRCRT